MTAGTEIVCSDVACKVEVEEKCVVGLDTSDPTRVGGDGADGNVGGNGNCNVGGDGKDDPDDSSYVFVRGIDEVTAGDPADTGGVKDIVPKSDPADEGEHVKKEELGTENGGIPVDPLVLENNGIVHESSTEWDADVQAVKDEVTFTNGSIVDSLVVLETNDDAQLSVNDHLDKISEEEEAEVKRPCEVEELNGMINVEGKVDDIGSEVRSHPDSILSPIDGSQVTVFDSEHTIELPEKSITQSVSIPDLIETTDESFSTSDQVIDSESEVTVNDGPESISNLIDKAECQVIVDGSESTGKPTEDVACQASTDGSESPGSAVKDREFQAAVDGSESIVSSIENQQSPVTDDGSESGANHPESVGSTMALMESARKLEEYLETSEVHVEAEADHNCGGIMAEHQSESVSTPPLEEKKFEGAVLGSATELEENPGSVVVLSEAADALANGQVEKIVGTVETGGTQVSQTEPVEHVLLEFNAEKAESVEQLENQVEECLEKPVNITSDEFEVKNEETKEQVKIEDEILESETPITENVENNVNVEDNAAESANEAEAPVETETTIDPITDETVALQCEENNSCVDATQTCIQSNGISEHAEILSSTDFVKSECKNGGFLAEKEKGSLSNTDDLAVEESKIETLSHPVTANSSAEGTECGRGIENVDVCDGEQTESEVKAPVGNHSTLSFPDKYVNPGSAIEFGSIRHHETVPNIHNDDVIAVPDFVTKPAGVAHSDNPDGSQGDRSSDKVSCPEVEDMDGVHSDEIPTSSIEGSVSDAIDAQNEEDEVLRYNFLIRIPRFEDETLRDQIRSAQLQVEEKTRLRDEIRTEIQGKRARLKVHNDAFHAVRSEETAARRLVRQKRQEIDAVQSVINRVKNAESVEDIDTRIYNMEHMIQHETLCLKDEKQFIRQIKQLKTLRDQLASNMGTEEEVQQALEQRDEAEERMKILRKELDSLKDKVSKAEAAVIAVGKKYDEESKGERELQAQFRAADDVRQKAYAHLNSLKKQSYDKNKNFRTYKDDVMRARDFASRGDKDALHRLCANQVEAFMEQWNNNDEFRNDYIQRCNMNASRRQKAFDGHSDEVGSVSVPVEATPVSVEVTPISAVENKHEVTKEPMEQKKEPVKAKVVTKASAKKEVIVEVDTKEEEKKPTKEEIELAKKAEEELAAKLKEQRRLEEKAKAMEALERKKRNAEKAQLKAELRARKEAEQKEKEREKRLRKKEKKKAGGDGNGNGEEAESSNEKEIEEVVFVKEKKKRPPAHFFSKQLKPKPVVPPPIANRNKKRWQQWGKIVLAAALILALFLLGNTGVYLNLKHLKNNATK